MQEVRRTVVYVCKKTRQGRMKGRLEKSVLA